MLVNGIGGVGKTTLAKAFVQNNNDSFNHIVWMTVTLSLKEAFISDKVFLHNMKLEDDILKLIEAKNQEDAYKLIINKLGTIEGSNLLVIDNAERKDEKDIENIKSLTHSNWKILITSREHIPNIKEYFLDVLSPEKAKDLFLTHLKREADQKELNALLKDIGYHTLTIELLAKTMEVNSLLTINDIRNALKKKQLDSKKLAVKIRSEHAGKEEIEVYSHLISIFDLSILTEEEQKLIIQFSVLPSREIELKLLCRLFNFDEENQNDLINFLSSLSNKGYLLKTGDKYKIHPIIQEISKYKLDYSITDFETLIESVSKLLHVDQSKDNPAEKFPFVDIGGILISNIEANEKFEESGKDFFKSFNYLRTVVALMYQDLGKYEEAADLLEKALKNAIKNFGEEHPSVARSQSNLALVYKDLGKYEEAADLLEKALKSAIKNFGEEHPSVARSQSNLATVYQDLGKYEEAIKLLEKSYNTFKKRLGENHPNTKTVKDNLEFVREKMKGIK